MTPLVLEALVAGADGFETWVHETIVPAMRDAEAARLGAADAERIKADEARAMVPHLTMRNGIALVSSVEVAAHFGKNHQHVLRDIKGLEIGPDLDTSFFLPCTVLDAYKRPQPAFEMTRDGFKILSASYTGPKAKQYRLAFIGEFNRIEQQNEAPQPSSPQSVGALISEAVNRRDNLGFDKAEATVPTTINLQTRDGKVLANSRDVAAIFGKRHDHVLRDIDALRGSPSLGDQQNQGVILFFPRASFDEKANKNVRFFEMTRDGFTLLAMGYEGQKALDFKLAYIKAFNEMEAALRQPAPAPALTREQRLAAALLEADEMMKEQAGQIAVMAPKAAAFERIAESTRESITIREACRELGVSEGAENSYPVSCSQDNTTLKRTFFWAWHVLHYAARPSTFRTVAACHCPPRAVWMPRAFRASATARSVPAPLACICRMIGRTFAAWASAPARCTAPPFALAVARFTGLPSFTPCFFFSARAARVRSAIRLRSFSASAAYTWSIKGSASAPSSATTNGTRFAMRPEIKATSRDRRHSFATTTGALAFFAWAKAALSFGRRSSASAPLPVSISTYSVATAMP